MAMDTGLTLALTAHAAGPEYQLDSLPLEGGSVKGHGGAMKTLYAGLSVSQHEDLMRNGQVPAPAKDPGSGALPSKCGILRHQFTAAAGIGSWCRGMSARSWPFIPPVHLIAALQPRRLFASRAIQGLPHVGHFGHCAADWHLCR
eukprot:s876_g8.t1